MIAKCISIEEYLDALHCLVLKYRFQLSPESLPYGCRAYNAVLTVTIDSQFVTRSFTVGETYSMERVVDSFSYSA